MINSAKVRSSERGGAGVKLLLALTILLLLAHAGFNYVPVAYQGANFKEEMQTAVINGLALPPNVKPLENIKGRINRAAIENDIPVDAFYEIKQVGNVVHAHVYYTKDVSLLPFGLYEYSYEFDHVATPTGFLMKDVQ